MAFMIDEEELKPGLKLFRRADVKHRDWYCRIKLPGGGYKFKSIGTADVGAAREQAYDYDAEIRFKLKHDVPIFNRTFAQVAADFAVLQQDRADTKMISAARARNIRSVIRCQLNPYVGAVQVHLIGHDRWTDYPLWRRKTGEGRHKGLAEAAAGSDDDGRIMVSDETIRFEMSIFRQVMSYAASKKYIPLGNRFEDMPALKKMRRDEFTPEEYRKLHTRARSWMKANQRALQLWYREVTYNFVLIMCNTGMRPSEARNLRWRDCEIKTDREGRKLVLMQVRGKGKYRSLVAAGNVGDYLDRIRAIAKATSPGDRVFTTYEGKPTASLYHQLVHGLLETAELTLGAQGKPRTTYCFRHTYATFRLSEGVDVYFLAQQMGTSVKMIEQHYGHVNAVKNADLILRGMPGWEAIEAATKASRGGTDDDRERSEPVEPATAKRAATPTRDAGKQHRASMLRQARTQRAR